MKKIYLTFDIETIVSGISRSDNYIAGVYLAAMFIAEELRKRELKATFFVSISSKQANIDQRIYTDHIRWLIQSLKSYENIKIEPHLHAYNLPVGFDCRYDEFNKYNLNQQIELLSYAKGFFYKEGIDVNSFRPGSFSKNDSYYLALQKSGYRNSSILQKDVKATINMIDGEVTQQSEYIENCGIMEYPVTSVKIKSIKRKIEVLNLSPDFFRLSSVENYLRELNYININFHSFSIYLNRLIRENHKNIICKNLKFLLFENTISKLLKLTSIQSINTKTVMSIELIRWLDFIERNKYDSYFIGE